MATQNEGTGLAGGLIVIGLLDTLMAKQIITRSETSCGTAFRHSHPMPRRLKDTPPVNSSWG
jgi:hypothetical protein